MDIKKIILVTFFFASLCFAQFEFQDNFDQYITGQQLVCQNPIDWATWSNTPCDPWEDPYLSSTYVMDFPNSLKIVYHNDLIKLLGNYSTGRNHITFYAYLPNGKSGELSLYSKFNPDPHELAFECYFDVGGTGRLMSIPGEPVEFNYTYNQWHLVWVVVDFDRDEAQFYLDYNFIHIWKWTQNGTITNQLAAQNFYGRHSNNDLYIDDYHLFENNCLWCYTPTEPRNLTAKQIFNNEPIIQLNWQPSLYWVPQAYEIIKKNGFPSDTAEYDHLDYVPINTLQYLDSNIVIDSTYTYGVIAMNMFGYSDTSNFATITVDPVTTLKEENTPALFSLNQNYPNPFNPTTKISWQSPGGSWQTLKIIDLLGNEVTTLVDEYRPEGKYEVEFDGTELPSGIYFYQLKAGSFVETNKMVLLK